MWAVEAAVVLGVLVLLVVVALGLGALAVLLTGD